MDPKAQALAMFSKLIDMALAKSVGGPKPAEVSVEMEAKPEGGEEAESGENEIDPALLQKLLGGE